MDDLVLMKGGGDTGNGIKVGVLFAVIAEFVAVVILLFIWLICVMANSDFKPFENFWMQMGFLVGFPVVGGALGFISGA